MFALTIELLAGRYVATAYNDRDRAEWPPHPARLFSALLATWADHEPDSGDGEQELQALRWLETQSAPDILASARAHAGLRDVVPVFVPVNDASVVVSPDREKLDALEMPPTVPLDAKVAVRIQQEIKKLRQKLIDDTAKAVAAPKKEQKSDAAAGKAVLPTGRPRQPRTFPSASPHCATLGFVWPDAELPGRLRPAMARLLSRLVRLGHSSTLVHGVIADEDAIATLARSTTRYRSDEEEGEVVIRWVNPGQVEQLRRAFVQHRETEPRVLPARFVRYREGDRAAAATFPHTVFEDDFIVFSRVDGPRLPITAAAGLARQLRRALMSTADQPVDEIISGHRPDGPASEQVHLAVVPLPVVNGRHADGSIIGVALILPRSIGRDARAGVMRAIHRLENPSQAPEENTGDAAVVSLKLGAAGILRLQRDVWGEDRRSTLMPSTWTRPSRRWASATPVALDRNPGDLHDPDPVRRQAAFATATASVLEAITRIGMDSRVVEIDVVRSCVLPGTAKPINHPRYPANEQRPQRVLVHVRLVFEQAVKGPLLLGAGRYHGLGLLVPLDSPVPREEEQTE